MAGNLVETLIGAVAGYEVFAKFMFSSDKAEQPAKI